jgi:hypothetical protein
MAWVSKYVRKKKTGKHSAKINWEKSGLGAPPAKASPLIEEIRLQGMVLASRGVGQAARSRRVGGQETASDKPATINESRR